MSYWTSLILVLIIVAILIWSIQPADYFYLIWFTEWYRNKTPIAFGCSSTLFIKISWSQYCRCYGMYFSSWTYRAYIWIQTVVEYVSLHPSHCSIISRETIDFQLYKPSCSNVTPRTIINYQEKHTFMVMHHSC